ncbi:hypothetical protein LguiA_034902 [Lonicera macranthoides]
MYTAIEFCERLSFFGLSTNLITYLTKVIQQELKAAAKNVNYWAGVTTMIPLLGGFFADAYIGRYSMILISSAIYLMLLHVPHVAAIQYGVFIPHRLDMWSLNNVTTRSNPKAMPENQMRKSKQASPGLLYEAPMSQVSQARLLGHTNNLRFLDKAAIIEVPETLPSAKKPSPWRLATVTQVEELKLLLNMIPIWLTSLAFGTCVAQTSTFFIKQSTVLDRKIGPNFEIPPATIYNLTAVGMILAVIIYDKIFVPTLRRLAGNVRGINILQRIVIAKRYSYKNVQRNANVGDYDNGAESTS